MPIVLILLLFGTVAGGGYFYYTDTQSTIAQLRDSNAQLKVSVETNERAIEAMEQQAEISAELSQELAEKLQVSESSRNRLIEVFGKHDLTRLALRKPGLIESRINNGTKKAFDGIESVSGSEVTEQ
jgi:hypothetical protein